MTIIKVDPIEYDLKFSRFLNSGRCYTIREWTVEDDLGHQYKVYEGMDYHLPNEDGTWRVIKGEDLIQGVLQDG